MTCSCLGTRTSPTALCSHPRATARALAALTLSLVLALAPAAGPAGAQSVRPDLWVADGLVYTQALSGNTLYIGGNFTSVGPATGSFVPVDGVTGAPVGDYPKVVGQVFAVAPDGAGGWYIGGLFSSVGGVPCGNLAHVLADGSVSDLRPEANGIVRCLSRSGATLYLGGAFTSVAGQPRNRIAALDLATGQPTGWNPDADAAVHVIATSGTTVYAGGDFATIGGQTRNCIAALDAASGQATAWDPSADRVVEALVVCDTTVYVGGAFQYVGGQPRNRVAALSAGTGLATAWDPKASGGTTTCVYALAVSGTTVYAGGDFGYIGGDFRVGLAALDATTGLVRAWNPGAGGSYPCVYELVASGNTVYAAGEFTWCGGSTRNRVAAIDASTGIATSWNPSANQAVMALGSGGAAIFVAGAFTSLGGQARRGLAALDLATGRATDWNPIAGGSNPYVWTVAVGDTLVYVGGTFTSVGGQPRRALAALSARTGLATPWNPDPNGVVTSVVPLDTTVYVGGVFLNIGGQARRNIAALSARSGLATVWNPNAVGTVGGPYSSGVYTIEPSGSTLYVGGNFTSIGGQSRRCLAVLDRSTGLATAWNPGADSVVRAIAVNGATVYVGGQFISAGGQPRNSVAALDAATGLALPWDPDVHHIACALRVVGSTVFVGGVFSSVGGQTRLGLAAIDAATGAVASWDPGERPYTYVYSLLVGGGALCVGGYYWSLCGVPHSCLAAVSLNVADVAEPAGSRAVALLRPNEPNPFRGATTIRFILPKAARVTLAVYDLAGRRVTTLLRDERRPAGTHAVEFRAPDLPSGVYLCRIEAGGQRHSRKLVLLR